MASAEFDIIAQYFSRSARNAAIAVGVGDDAAVFDVMPGQQLVTSVDASVAGIHFLKDADPFAVGWKSLAVSLSDLAAMGAQPLACLLTLQLPSVDETWLQGFAKGFYALADRYHVDLIGGDTTRGELAVTTTVFGVCSTGQAILRSGAQVGDGIYVSGPLGGAGLALQQMLAQQPVDAVGLQLLNCPRPQVALGLELGGLAHAMIDVSDGLLSDLGHILQASHVGAELNVDRLPATEALSKLSSMQRYHLQLTAGDDYQLCFTAAADQHERVLALSDTVRCIGKIRQDPGMLLLDQQGQEVCIDGMGFQHFR